VPPTYANGHISATGDPIHFMFGSRVEFSGTADRTALSMYSVQFEQIQEPCLFRGDKNQFNSSVQTCSQVAIHACFRNGYELCNYSL